MSEENQKNHFFRFLSPNNSNQNNPENNTKPANHISGGRLVEETYNMLEKAVEQSIDGIAVADLSGIIQFCNQAWAKMHGYQIYEILGKHLSIFHTHEQLEKIVTPFNNKVKKLGACQCEVGHVRKDGKTFLTLMSVTLLKNDKGKSIGLLGIAKNITKHKHLQGILAASERKYRSLFENSIEGIGVSSGNRVVAANKALLDIFGYNNREEFLKTPLLYHVALESREMIKERIRRRQKGESVASRFEYKIIRKDGEIKELEASASEVVIGKEKLVLTTFRDITEQKKVEKRISQINECFLGFSSDSEKNINSLVVLCGEIMQATCALYNRLEDGLFCSIGQWTPEGYNSTDKPEGHICYDVIKQGGNNLFIIRDLPKSDYAQTDPNVLKYKLETYVGLPVSFENVAIGSLCVVYQKDFSPSEDEKKFMQIIASAIAVEEKRRIISKEVEEGREKYKTLTENINIGIYRVDAGKGAEGRFIEVNPALIKMFGYDTKEEFLSKKTFDLYHNPAERERFVNKLLSSGFLRNEELLLKKKDGSLIICSLSAVTAKDQDGEVKYFDGTIEDITQRKRLEKELSESESQYRMTINSMADAIHVVDRDLRIILLNEYFKQWNRLLGIGEETIGKTIFEAFPFLPETVSDEYRKVFESGEILLTEESNKIEGKEFITETRKIPIYEGEKVVRVLTVIRDITARKKAEEALQGKEHFLVNVFESIQDGVSILDKDMNIVQVNRTMEKWYGHAMPIIGKKCYEAYHGRQKQCDVCPTIKTLETGKSAYEIVAKTGAGGEIVGWLDLYSFPLVDTQTNQITGVIEYVRDITKRRQVEEKSEQLNKELFKSNKRLRQLVLRDSHTGLYNHRYLQEVIEAEFCRAERYAHPLSVIMLDIDYFKSINDVYSHQFGDLVLKQFGRQLKRMVRKYDIVVRFGGEEFVIISPSTDKPTTLALAQRIMDKVNLSSFGEGRQNVKLTLSMAAVSYPKDKVSKGMDLIELSSRILDRAKEDGGNRVYSAVELKDKSPVSKEDEENPHIRFLKGKIDRLNKRANQNLIESVFAFARTIKLKDHYTGEHVENTVHYATEIAKRLSLPKEEIEHVRRAAMVHDLGKVGVSENILLKKSKLTRREFTDIRKHPQIGADILRPIHFLNNIIPLIHSHHERWDGKGYPVGLKREEIPLGARIVAIADVYQALISDRPYRKAYSKNKAIDIIKAGSGNRFDPKIVDTFLEVLQR